MFRRAYLAIVIAACSLSLSGCLTLGGRTTHVHEDPETKSRVASLEHRVRQLEAQRNVTCEAVPVPVQ